MIRWLNPAGLLALLAIAVPIAVHLLQRRPAARVVVPTTRFVTPSDRAAVRPRRPADALLLLLRILIVAAAALALARPIVVTRARLATWSERTARVVLVDTAIRNQPDVTPLAEAERRAASESIVLEAERMDDGLRRAALWLSRPYAGPREVVVLSDFRLGGLTERDIAELPAPAGIRFVRVGAPPESRTLTRAVLADGGVARQRIDVRRDATGTMSPPGREPVRGLVIEGADDDVRDRLLRVVTRLGAAAPSETQPLRIRFGREVPEPSIGKVTGWQTGLALRLARQTSTPIAISNAGGALTIDSALSANSAEAAELLVAALNARAAFNPLDAEVATVSDQQLAAWTRPALPPGPDAWRETDLSDGRWFWIIALVLLGAEPLVRRRVRQRRAEVPRAA